MSCVCWQGDLCALDRFVDGCKLGRVNEGENGKEEEVPGEREVLSKPEKIVL